MSSSSSRVFFYIALESPVKVFPRMSTLCAVANFVLNVKRKRIKFTKFLQIKKNKNQQKTVHRTILETFVLIIYHLMRRSYNIQMELPLKKKKKRWKTNSSVLNAVCLEQLLFHTSGMNPATLSLAQRLGLGQLSWSESLA